jgi:hypothetical protein
LGGRVLYWEGIGLEFLRERKCEITIINNEASEGEGTEIFKEIQCDIFKFEYRENEFDYSHSNSVIEHVGDWAKMEQFARISKSIAPAYFVQTPYFWFPVEPHFSSLFFHWLPEATRAGLLLRRQHGFTERAVDIGSAMRSVQHARLLDRRMIAYLFPDARLVNEKFFGMTKSIMAMKG